MRSILFFLSFLFLFFHTSNGTSGKNAGLIEADDPLIQYTGRIDFSNPKKPTFWAPGVYIKAKFKGASCTVLINDEALGGNTFNYLEIVIDDKIPVRVQTTGKINKIKAAEGLSPGPHTILICKNTESNIGYLEFLGLECDGLMALPPKPTRKLEFIGNSITCGTGIDKSVVNCGKGRWHDQHNAYMSYGPLVARSLNAQWLLSAYSGIGLIHSCCNLTITMPQIIDKINLNNNQQSISWDFSRYHPDAVTICLGQNDGIQDSTAFCSAYVNFIGTIRNHYPSARIVCLTSPMADKALAKTLKNYLTGVVNYVNKKDNNVHMFFFSKNFNSGCDRHPDMSEHQLIANELAAYLASLLNWRNAK